MRCGKNIESCLRCRRKQCIYENDDAEYDKHLKWGGKRPRAGRPRKEQKDEFSADKH